MITQLDNAVDTSYNRVSQRRISEIWWRRTTKKSLGVSFGIYLKRCTYGTSCLGNYETSLQRSCATSWRSTPGTFWRRTTKTSLIVLFENNLRGRRDIPMVCCYYLLFGLCHDVFFDFMTSSIHTTETSWRCPTQTSLDVSFETSLRRHWDEQKDVTTMRVQHLLAGCVINSLKFV